MVPILVIATIVAFVLVDLLVLSVRRRQQQPAAVLAGAGGSVALAGIDAESVAPPAGVFVDRSNTWMTVRPEGSVRIGATALLLRALGRPDTVLMPTYGQKIRRGEPLFSLRVAGREATFRSPVDGVVTATNRELAAAPEGLLQQPYDRWLVELRSESLSEAIAQMTVAEKAVAWMRGEYARLKDALVQAASGSDGLAQMADGGTPVEGALSHLDAEAWEKVVESFLKSDRPN